MEAKKITHELAEFYFKFGETLVNVLVLLSLTVSGNIVLRSQLARELIAKLRGTDSHLSNLEDPDQNEAVR